MAVAALTPKPALKTFHATVHVTRVEQWCIEAKTAEEARAAGRQLVRAGERAR
jgi:hypothetical protein